MTSLRPRTTRAVPDTFRTARDFTAEVTQDEIQRGEGAMKRALLHSLFAVALTLAATLAAMPAMAQPLTGAPADPQFKYSTPMPPGVAGPDKVEMRLGTLNFFDGFPDKASAEKLYDNLDFQRAVQAYLLAIPAVSQAANRNAYRTLGPPNTVVPIFEQLQDARSIFEMARGGRADSRSPKSLASYGSGWDGCAASTRACTGWPSAARESGQNPCPWSSECIRARWPAWRGGRPWSSFPLYRAVRALGAT